MAFQESGTKILHDLGILNSNVQSPKRQQFRADVEVPQTSITQKADDGDDSTQRLIVDETTQNGNQNVVDSNTLFKQLILYGFALITINAVWILLADICRISDLLKVDNTFELSWIPACFGGGIFIGSYFIVPLLLKFYALFTIQFFVSLAIGVAILQYNFLQFSSLLFAMSFLGIAFGVVERCSYLYIFRVLHGSKRKVLFLYAVLAFGLVFTNCAVWLSSELMKNNNFSNEIIHRRVKHDDGLPAINLNISEPLGLMVTENYYRPTKPSSAIGISEDQDTKTAENAEKRKLAEQKKENQTIVSNGNVDCATNPIAEGCINNSTTITPTIMTTSTTTTTTTTTTIKPPTTTTPKNTLLFEGFTPVENSVDSLPIPRSRNRLPNTSFKNDDTQPTKSSPEMPPSENEKAKPSTAYTIFISFLVILFLAAVNFGGFACNYFWFKDTLIALQISAENYPKPSTLTRVTSAILWVLSDFILYGLFTLIPFIYSGLFNTNHGSYPLIYGVYIWGSVFLLRSLLFAVSNFAISKKCIRILLFASFCSVILYFMSSDKDLRFTCLIATGVTVSSLTILIALHQQEAMNLSPYITSDRYLFWSCIGRFFGPLFMGKILNDYSIQMLVNLTFICLIIMLIAFYYFSENITSVARQRQLQDLKMDISSSQASNNNQASTPTDSTSTAASSIKTKSTRSGKNKYSLIEAESDDWSNCLISDSEDDELLYHR